MEHKSFVKITVNGKGTPTFLKDSLSNPNMNILMDRVLDKLFKRGWKVVCTYNHSSYFANAEEVKAWGNSNLSYDLTDNLDNFITYSEDSHFDIVNNGRRHIDDYHFDHSTIIGRHLSLVQVGRHNGTDADVSVRIRVMDRWFKSELHDHDFYCEKYCSKCIADEKISLGMGDKAIENRLNKLGI